MPNKVTHSAGFFLTSFSFIVSTKSRNREEVAGVISLVQLP
jgi:hypothetical protein